MSQIEVPPKLFTIKRLKLYIASAFLVQTTSPIAKRRYLELDCIRCCPRVGDGFYRRVDGRGYPVCIFNCSSRCCSKSLTLNYRGCHSSLLDNPQPQSVGGQSSSIGWTTSQTIGPSCCCYFGFKW